MNKINFSAKIRALFPVLAGILLFALFWPSSPTNAFRWIKEVDGITEYALKSNGLRVLLTKAPFPGLVAIASIYNAGSANDQLGHYGTAHFLEHITFRGTKRFNPTSHNSIPGSLQQIGALINAQTSNDVTTYYEIVPNDQVDFVLEVETDRMRQALLSEEDVEREIDVIMNEYEILQNDSKMQLENAVWNAAFRKHPYRHPIIGYLESIQGMTPETLRKFYNQYYQPHHLTLVLIGDFDKNRALSLIKKHYGPIPQIDEASLEFSEPPQVREERVVLEKSDTENRVYIAQKSPSGTHPDVPALTLLSKILTGGTASRLQKSLIQTGAALEIESEVSELKDPGLFIVSARLSQNTAHELVERTILATYENIKNSAVTTDELETAKRQTIAQHLFSKDDPIGFIHEMIDAIGVGDWAQRVSRVKQIESVTTDDILRVARQYLVPNQTTIGYLISKRQSPDLPLAKNSLPILPSESNRSKDKAVSPPVNQQLKSVPPVPGARTESISPIQVFKISGASVIFADTGARGIVHMEGSLNGAGRFYSPNPILAELTARLISTNTKGYEKGGVARILERAGSQISFEADSERLTISGKCLKQETERTLELLIKQLRDPKFEANEFELIKSQLKSSILAEKNSAETQAATELSRAIYPENHPFHEPTSQEKLDWLEKTTLDDVRKFHALHFGPRHLSIVFAGDLDSKRIKNSAQKALSVWPASPAQLPEIQKLPFTKSLKQRDLLIPSSVNTTVQFGIGVPITRQHSDFPALQMANFILGGSSSSRLFHKMRQELGLAYQIRSSLAGFNRRLQGFLKIQMAVKTDKKLEAIQALKNELSAFRKSPISKTELQKKKAELLGLYRIGLSSSAGLANQILILHETGLELTEIENFIKKINRLTPRDIQAVIQRYCHPEAFQIVTAGGS